jgi:hypothetical protein
MSGKYPTIDAVLSSQHTDVIFWIYIFVQYMLGRCVTDFLDIPVKMRECCKHNVTITEIFRWYKRKAEDSRIFMVNADRLFQQCTVNIESGHYKAPGWITSPRETIKYVYFILFTNLFAVQVRVYSTVQRAQYRFLSTVWITVAG